MSPGGVPLGLSPMPLSVSARAMTDQQTFFVTPLVPTFETTGREPTGNQSTTRAMLLLLSRRRMFSKKRMKSAY